MEEGGRGSVLVGRCMGSGKGTERRNEVRCRQRRTYTHAHLHTPPPPHDNKRKKQTKRTSTAYCSLASIVLGCVRRLRKRQNFSAFSGASPFPVVAQTKTPTPICVCVWFFGAGGRWVFRCVNVRVCVVDEWNGLIPHDGVGVCVVCLHVNAPPQTPGRSSSSSR